MINPHCMEPATTFPISICRPSAFLFMSVPEKSLKGFQNLTVDEALNRNSTNSKYLEKSI